MLAHRIPPRLVPAVLGLALFLFVAPGPATPQDSRPPPESKAASQPTQPEQPPPLDPGTQPAEDSEKAKPLAPLPGPKYLNLRYDEDFSYLDGPSGSYQPDLFDPIKWIRLTDDLTLSLGGSMRARLEAGTHNNFGSIEPTQNTFFLHRYFLHADLRYRKLARFYLEGINAMIEDNDWPLLPTQENRWDFHQFFVDLRPLGEEVPLTLRTGRQELLYGNERLISPLDWANTRRRFDGVKLFYEHEKFQIDAFYVKPVPINLSEGLNRKLDHYQEETDFYGLYSTYKGIPNHVFDLYFLALRDTGDLTNPNGRVGDLSLYTIGGRLGGRAGPLDYEGELAGQWGKFAGDTIHAWMAALDSGLTFEQCPWAPRIGVGFDYGSGDDDPGDGTVETFNQLFPLGHKYLGYLDLVGRQNILATNVNLTFKPHKKATTRLAWYTFWNDATRDALYNAAGAAIRRAPQGGAGHDIGNELDLTIQYALDVHQSLLFGYSHFWGTNFIRETGVDRDPDLIYLQYEFRF